MQAVFQPDYCEKHLPFQSIGANDANRQICGDKGVLTKAHNKGVLTKVHNKGVLTKVLVLLSGQGADYRPRGGLVGRVVSASVVRHHLGC